MPALTPERRVELIARIKVTPAEVAAAVGELSVADLTTPYMAGEWTVAQNVHHLADAHINAFTRIKLVLTEDRPTFKLTDQDRWAATADAMGADLSASMAILHGVHARWAELLESLAEADWQRVGVHPQRGDMAIDDLVRIYGGHGAAHLDQIARTLAAKS